MDLEFDDGAIEAIADKTLERKTGARGLRAIMEQAMMDLMYRIPSDDTIASCGVTKEVIEGTGEPILTHKEKQPQNHAADALKMELKKQHNE